MYQIVFIAPMQLVRQGQPVGSCPALFSFITVHTYSRIWLLGCKRNEAKRSTYYLLFENNVLAYIREVAYCQCVMKYCVRNTKAFTSRYVL